MAANAPSLTDWQAENLARLRQIWADLRPDSADLKTERRFAGQLLTAEQAGDVFERWVIEAFRLSGMAGHYGFTVPLSQSGSTREQIDGMVFDGWQGFLIESKFWTGKVDFGPIALLHTIVGARLVGTMGLFFSVFGYTAAAEEGADRLRPLQVLLFDGDDLQWGLGQPGGTRRNDEKRFKGRMREMVRRKWQLAMKLGRPQLRVTDPMELFNHPGEGA